MKRVQNTPTAACKIPVTKQSELFNCMNSKYSGQQETCRYNLLLKCHVQTCRAYWHAALYSEPSELEHVAEEQNTQSSQITGTRRYKALSECPAMLEHASEHVYITPGNPLLFSVWCKRDNIWGEQSLVQDLRERPRCVLWHSCCCLRWKFPPDLCVRWSDFTVLSACFWCRTCTCVELAFLYIVWWKEHSTLCAYCLYYPLRTWEWRQSVPVKGEIIHCNILTVPATVLAWYPCHGPYKHFCPVITLGARCIKKTVPSPCFRSKFITTTRLSQPPEVPSWYQLIYL